MPHALNESLSDLLRATSRSFYLTLRVLPAAVRQQIGLAYLLARTTDTVADTEIVPIAKRLDALQQLRERILGRSSAALNFGELARQQGAPAEKRLLEEVGASLAALPRVSTDDQERIRDVLAVIISGQELDLRRFGSGAKPVVALATAEELDDYTYRVAGCVGEFWTKICRAHLFPAVPLDDAQLLADSVRFGKGLQLVNILRDLPADLKSGRCYLPRAELAEIGLTPEDLGNPQNEPRLRPLYDRWLDRAEGHLFAGWHYTNTLPRNCRRVRLACAWPVLIGLETTRRLRDSAVLAPEVRIKVSRREVRKILARSILRLPFPGWWRQLVAEPSASAGKAVASRTHLA